MTTVRTEYHPPVFKGPFPIRSVPQCLCDAVLQSHSVRCMVLTKSLIPLDNSARAKEGHCVFDFDTMTCAVLEDKISFEEVRSDFYLNHLASNTVSHSSPPVFSAMPDVPVPVN